MNYFNQNVGLVAWSNLNQNPLYLCKGSFQEEDTQSDIYLYQFDPFNTQKSLKTIGQFNIESKMNCLSWTQLEGYNKGIITTSLIDGSLTVLDADKIINNYLEGETSDQESVLCCLELEEEQQYFCMEFNQFKQGLLAIGGQDLFIVNFEKSMEQPSVFRPNQNQKDEDRVYTSLSWNKTKAVQHILASAQDNGDIDIIDLKLKKSIFTFNDDRQDETGREINLAWNTKIPTQIAVAFDNEQSGVQIWDLRSNKAPFKVLNQFGRVHAIDWNLSQTNQLLFANKNNQIFSYDYLTGDVLQNHRDNFNVFYTKFVPGLQDTYYTVSEEGDLMVTSNDQQLLESEALKLGPMLSKQSHYSVLNSNGTGLVLNKDDSECSVQRVLVTGNLNNEYEESVQKLDELVNNDMMIEQVAQSLKNQNQYPESLIDLVMLMGETEEQKLEALGVNIDKFIEATEKLTGYEYKKQKVEGVVQDTPKSKNPAEISEQDAFDFFSNLGKTKEETIQNNQEEQRRMSKTDVDGYEQPLEEDMEQKNFTLNQNWDKGIEKFIKKNIVVNNYEGALDCAIKANRIFEAFLIAYSHPQDSQYYMEYLVEKLSLTNQDDFLTNFLKPLSLRKYEDIIATYDKTQWIDALTFIVKNVCDKKQRQIFYDQLSDRFDSNDEEDVLIQICLFAERPQKLFEMIQKKLEKNSGLKNLIEVFQLLYLYNMKNQNTLNESIHCKLLKLCNILLDMNKKNLSFKLLQNLGNQNNEQVIMLQNRISQQFILEGIDNELQCPQLIKVNFNFPKKIKKSKYTKPKTYNKIQQKNDYKKNKNQPPVSPFVKQNMNNQQNQFNNNIITSQQIEYKQIKRVEPPKDKHKVPKQFKVPKPPKELKQNNNIAPPRPPKFNQQMTSTLPKPPKFNQQIPQNLPQPPKQNYNNSTVPLPPKRSAQSVVSNNSRDDRQLPLPPKPNLNNFNKPPKMNMPPPPSTNLQSRVNKPPKMNLPPPPNNLQSRVNKPPQMNMPPPPPKQNTTQMNRQPLPQRNNNYDANKVNDVIDFVQKAPGFINDIAENSQQAQKMNSSLQYLQTSIQQKKIETEIFNSIHQIVHLITESQCKQAYSQVNQIIPRYSGEFGMVLNTLKTIAEVLSQFN